MALTVLIAEDAGGDADPNDPTFTDKTALTLKETVTVSNAIDIVATATFTLIDQDGTLSASEIPKTGQPVKITDGGSTVYFYGTIDTLTINIPTGTGAAYYECSCTDYAKVLERHLIANSYQDLTIFGLVGAIIDEVNDPTDEGITYEIPSDDTSALIGEIRFNYVTAKDALDRLALLGTGTNIYNWYVDSARAVQFDLRDTTTSGTALTDDASSIALANSIRVTQSRNEYRNVQYISNAKYYTTSQTDGWSGDGTTTQFVTRYPLGKSVTATVDGSAVTIAEQGLVTAQFQYEVGKPGVWNGTHAALSSSEDLRVTYLGLYPTTATDNDADAIAARQAIEGGSGRYERMDNAADMIGSEIADAFMDGLLAKNSDLTTVIEYETDTAGLVSGTNQSTTLDRIFIDGASISGAAYLIESVSGRDIGIGALRYKVRTVSGKDPAQWEDYFLELKNANKTTMFDNTISLALTEVLGPDTFAVVDSGDPGEVARDISSHPYIVSDSGETYRSFVGYAEVM